MIESLSKASEIAAKAFESKSTFDPDKFVEKKADNKDFDINKSEKLDNKQYFDPDKFIEKAEHFEGDEENHHLHEGLTDEQKERIKKETGWSDEIVDAIGSMEEYKIYKDAGLVEAEINGKKCLINPNIDMEQKDIFGQTNKERMEQGLAPLDKDGNPIELHHIGQHADSPLAELTRDQHRGGENFSILHDTKKESEIDRVEFGKERENHWIARAEGETK